MITTVSVHTADANPPTFEVRSHGNSRWIKLDDQLSIFLAGKGHEAKDAATLRAMAKVLNEAAEEIDPRPWVKLTATNRQANVETGVVYDVSPPLEQDTPPQFGQPESEE